MGPSIDRRILLTAAAGVTASISVSRGMATTKGSIIERYTLAWEALDLGAILACVHSDIEFVGPNVQARGRDGYAKSTKKFIGLLQRASARTAVEAAGQAMIAWDFACRPPVGSVPTAELVDIRDGLIGRSEIFFDTKPFAALAALPESVK